MWPDRLSHSAHRLAVLGALILTLGASHCATIVEGTSQSVLLVTNPPGQSVTFEGRVVADGEVIFIQKKKELPHVMAGGNQYDLTYDPDPWLLGDVGLLVFYIFPGLVGGGVDYATGAWRRFHDPQVIFLPDTE